MEDDQFIREVNEEMRSEQLQSIWDKYGKYIIGAAVAIVVGTAGVRGYDYYTKQQAAASGDEFDMAIELSNDGKHDEAIAKLEELANSGSGQYPALARIRVAAELANKGDAEKAVAEFDAIAADTSYNKAFRDIARLRSGLLMVDEGSLEDVKQRLDQLAQTGHAFRHSAREGLGLANYKAGKFEEALGYFNEIVQDSASTSGIRTRARIMIELLAGQGVSTETS